MAVKTKYKSVFISDVHMGVSSWQVDILLHWLKQIDAENYFLVGDIVDIWELNRSWSWPSNHNKLVTYLISLSDSVNIKYLVGNHDDVLRKFISVKFAGIEMLDEVEYIGVGGSKLLVMHGDKFDSFIQNNKWIALLGSFGNSAFSNVANMVGWVMGKMGFSRRWSLAAKIKLSVEDLVNPGFEQKFKDSIIAHTKQRNFDGVVVGHTHIPAVERIDDINYYNCVDFIDAMTLLVEHENGEFELLSFDEYIKD